MKNPPAHQVDVQMKNRLSAPRSIVNDSSISFGINFALASQSSGNRQEVPEHGFVFGRRFH